MAKPWMCRLRLHNWEDREIPRLTSTTKCVCAATLTETEGAPHQADSRRRDLGQTQAGIQAGTCRFRSDSADVAAKAWPSPPES